MIFDVARSLDAVARQGAEGCCKIAEDLARYRALIAAYRPDLVVECGTFTGRSAVWFARAAGCDVVTVDLYPRVDAETYAMSDRVTWVVGDSVSPVVVAKVTTICANAARPLVVLDSDHSAGHVLEEMRAYGSLVPPGGFMVVEDGIVRWMTDHPYAGSPLDAIEAWLSDHDDWSVDEDLCAMSPVSMHPLGFLRRAV